MNEGNIGSKEQNRTRTEQNELDGQGVISLDFVFISLFLYFNPFFPHIFILNIFIKLVETYNPYNPVNMTKRIYKRELIYNSNTNVLGLIVFCTAFGILCGQLGSEADTMVRFFVILNEIIMKIVGIVMWYSPIGIMSLITGKIVEIADIYHTAASVGMYMVTVIVGLIIHACITLPLIFYVCTRQNPLTFFKGTSTMSHISFLYIPTFTL